jgi:hypothetical protein
MDGDEGSEVAMPEYCIIHPATGIGMHAMAFILSAIGPALSVAATESGPARQAGPRCIAQADGTHWCDNGILRIRNSAVGITWFDVYHPKEKIWYVNKNNLNLHVSVPGAGWQNSELDRVQSSVSLISSTNVQMTANHKFVFPHGAIINLEMTLVAGEPKVTFQAHLDPRSEPVDGFFWQVSFGQAEAVNELHFDGHDVNVHDLPQPFPGRSLAVQHVQWFGQLPAQDFYFSGSKTATADANNPAWMTRVLGLKQHITWALPMRSTDKFAFEARDVPWQQTWGIPATRPWIEGLWFVRDGSFLEGDKFSYEIDDYWRLD